ncbi:MAG: prepilin-type cleavage/methylation domain-containing protein [Zetaproteobacteria bacterium CG12_big_fil_rev_8_21_14_0_65_54_13]|nr:MAG: prepilin-type cleavage/methylation domain-containing protein [Zetaproteobacteria bacterium CG12_big_fil_rev_8_21_14_0_65_54_13]PIX55336.1 MAG: prepilin-type cleavage/methylation domain-containing protein [Zetaproteobacteria bacterium CG_4_10_14_3_um_filter_54_28]PJA27276.1 MAG: prepilin-type cleavage/methylation domain-containing protein [Zetaproteobacteria bacterium CG_4_9_14_3_um_filter_54_145]
MRREKGFTLIEVLITLVVVTVGVMALSKFTIAIMGSGQVSRERLTAVHLAEQVLEHWQHDASDYAPVIATAGCALSDAGGAPSYPVTTTCTSGAGVGISYTISVNESAATGPLPANLSAVGNFTQQGYANTPKTKVITVSWSHKGATRSIYLTHLSEPK